MRNRPVFSAAVRTGIIGALLFVFFTSQGCLTYSSFQSARIVERGHPHATLGISRSGILDLDEKESEFGWWTLDGDMRFGIAKRVDGSVRLSIFHNVPEGWGGGQFSCDIRGGIIDDYLAVAFPFSINMGDFHFYTLRFQPGFVGTIPLNDRLTRKDLREKKLFDLMASALRDKSHYVRSSAAIALGKFGRLC